MNGERIPGTPRAKNIYVPELIFGHLLTSKAMKRNRSTWGKNRWEGKLANISPRIYY